MSETTAASSGASIAEEQAIFNLQRVYLRDCSLEIPSAPQVFIDSSEPRLEFQIDTSDQELGQDLSEVSVRCTVTCRLGENIGFLVEATQSAIFEIKGVTEEQRILLKGISCPNIIYPYLRAIVSDVCTRAGFPPVLLSEVNFQAMFEAQQQAASGAPN